jgi:peroxiredoxin Q/BCP
MQALRLTSAAALWLGLLALGGLRAADEAKSELKVGDKAPEFTVKDDADKDWKLSDHVGKHILVIYFYPGDLTGGCTKQACAFRDDSKKLAEKGVEVVGVSGDSVKNHQLFKKVHKLDFTLLADEDGKIAKAYGVPFNIGGESKVKDGEGNDITLKRGATINRWTFVIGKDGKILDVNTKVVADQDSKKILDFVEKLDKK